jgi:hypothetical protein
MARSSLAEVYDVWADDLDIEDRSAVPQWRIEFDYGPQLAEPSVILQYDQSVLMVQQVRTDIAATQAKSELNELVRSRMVLLGIGLVLSVCVGAHFILQGKVIYLIPAFAAAMYFILDLIGTWAEHRDNISASVSSSSRSHNVASHFLAR